MKHARISRAGPFCSSVRRRGESLSILTFGLRQGSSQHHSATAQFGSQDKDVECALQIALKRRQNVLDIRCAFDVTCQMKDRPPVSSRGLFFEPRLDPQGQLATTVDPRRRLAVWTIDGMYLRALLAQTAAQMGANESIGAGDENFCPLNELSIVSYCW